MEELVLRFDWWTDYWGRNPLGGDGNLLDTWKMLRLHGSNSDTGPVPSIRSELNVPLDVTTHSPRRTLPAGIVDLLQKWDAKELYVGIE